ncbi:MAG: GAF domain-containing protein [Nitrospirae bacterium]|nr:GAF domain-containing protein [Nitrospirota bacterium]
MKELFHKINSNLKAKIVILTAVLLAGFFTALVAYNIRSERSFYLTSVENQLRMLSNTIERSLVDAMGRDERDEVQRIMERIGSSGDIEDIRIFSDSKVILRSSNPAEIGTHIDEENYGKYKQSVDTFLFSKAGQKKLFLIKPILNRPACFGCHDSSQQINGVLEVSFSLLKAEAEINQHLRKLIIASALISLTIVLAVIILLEFLVTRPIYRLREAMSAAESGGDVSLDGASGDEIGQLQKKFVQMLGSIRHLNDENTKKEMELFKSVEVSNSHARMKSVMEAMPDGISILTRDMVIQDLNPRSQEIFPGAQRGDFCYRVIHGRSEPCAHCGVIKVFEDGQVHEHQSTFYLPDGKERIVHSISAPVKDKDDNITHAIEVVRDITDRIRADKAKIEAEHRHKKELEAMNLQLSRRVKEVEEANNQIAMLIKDLAHKNTELEKVVERLTTVNHIGNILNSLLDKDNVVEVIVTTMARTMNAEICSLMLMNEVTGELDVAFAVGLDGIRLRSVKVGEGISGYVAQQGKPLLVVDIEKDPRFQRKASDPQYTTTSLIAAPLFIKGKVIGILNVNNKKTGEPFNHNDLDLLTTVAGQAAIAVENSNLYRDIRSSYFDTVRALVNALEAKDKYSKGHSERVTLLAMMIAEEMDLPEDRKQALQHAGVLHDIGKIGISLSILNKDGKLTGEEYDMIKNHPLIGEKILDPITFLKDVKTIVGEHHERYDGKGYPHQKMGAELSLEARILAVADTFDALTSDRPYRKALPFEDAVAEIQRCASSQFDPDVVDVFLKTIGGGGESTH